MRMVLHWFKKKPPEPSDPAQEAAIHYLLRREKQKSTRLVGHIQRVWASPEEERSFLGIEAILKKHMPLYVIKDMERVRRDHSKGLFKEIPPRDRELLVRLMDYSWMVEGFSQETVGVNGTEWIYTLFERARHQRLLAYHLYQLVERLEEELKACRDAGLQQFMYEALIEKGLIKSGVQILIWDSLSLNQKKEMLQKERLKGFLRNLSLELAHIMVREIKEGVNLMQRTLTERALQKEPIAFEEEVGLDKLKEKIFQLQEFAENLHIGALEKQLLVKQAV
ncbi:MAG: hypothetical protein NTY13_00325 [Chlamydiae bacterium]|nr:hypothetical protein [Chlamydiota bacterium]